MSINRSISDCSSLYTPQEIADRCGLSRRRVYDWLSWGWLRGHRHGGRWKVASSDWDFFVQICRNKRGRLMPSLRDWQPLWAKQTDEAVPPSAPDRLDEPASC